ncbi:MAG: type II toxin-antitoxin system RelE/ParE family toxin [Pirellulales bacterium]
MNYAIEILRSARKQLERIASEHQERVLIALEGLAETPRPEGCTKLTSRNAWRIRIGDYRVVYEIDDDLKNVVVVVIAHRRDAYRNQ